VRTCSGHRDIAKRFNNDNNVMARNGTKWHEYHHFSGQITGVLLVHYVYQASELPFRRLNNGYQLNGE